MYYVMLLSFLQPGSHTTGFLKTIQQQKIHLSCHIMASELITFNAKAAPVVLDYSLCTLMSWETEGKDWEILGKDFSSDSDREACSKKSRVSVSHYQRRVILEAREEWMDGGNTYVQEWNPLLLPWAAEIRSMCGSGCVLMTQTLVQTQQTDAERGRAIHTHTQAGICS